MAKYGWRDGSLTAKDVEVTGAFTADSITTDALTLDATTTGTAVATGTAYLPLTVNGSTYYVQINK